LVYRADKKGFCDAYVWNIRRTLPEIPIPLRAADPAVPLNLALAVNVTYDRGKYERSLRYDRPLDVKLSPEDRDWAEAIGAGAGKP
jgi:hypothetical protein